MYRALRGTDQTKSVGCFSHFTLKEVTTKSCENLKKTYLLVCFLQVQRGQAGVAGARTSLLNSRHHAAFPILCLVIARGIIKG